MTVDKSNVSSDGPIQNYDGDYTSSGWSSRPVLARVLRLIVLLLPIAGSFLVTWLAAKYVPPAEIGMNTILWWVLVIVTASLTMFAIERVARRGLPLVALLKMNLVFPEEAPSRFSTALRTGTTKQLERRLEEMRMLGLHDSDEVNYGQQMLELVAALNSHDRLTRGHCERVRAYTDMVIEEMGIEGDDANRLRWSALLHDVGKIMVPASVLNKDGRPNDEEWELLKSHTWQGQAMVEPISDWLGEWSRSVGEHHERWDGDGYPNGLAANEIHLGARIVAVTDAFDVMTSARSYKKPIPAEAAREEIARCSGTQFDPEVVRAFLNIGIGRLRLAVGPLTWLANIPSAGQIPVAPVATPITNVVASVVGATAAAVTGGAGGILTPDPVPQTPVAFSDDTPEVITTLPPLVTTAAPPVITVAVASVPPETTPTTSTTTTSTTSTTSTTAAPRTAGVSTSTSTTTTLAPADPPIANDVSVNTPEDLPIEVVLSGAVGTGQPRFEVTVQPQNGTLKPIATVNPTSSAGEIRYLYTPNPDFAGTDIIRYEICDDSGRCDPAAVEIAVTAVNDAPVPLPDRIEAREDAPLRISVDRLIANDTDVDGQVSLESFSQPANGVLTRGADGRLTYTPNPGFEGEDFFTYTATDGTDSTTATVTVIVVSTQDDPVGEPDTFNGAEDRVLVLDTLLANDSDADPLDTIDIDSYTQPANGTVIRNVAGDLVYNPDRDWSGTDTFTYVVVDDKGNTSAPVLVTLELVAVNDGPVGSDDIGLQVDEDELLVIDWATLLANDTDVDDPDLTISSVNAAATPGNVAVDETNRTISLTPTTDYAGIATFTYLVCDAEECDGPISVTIDVANVNDAPVATADSVVGDEDTRLVLDLAESVLANDTDVDTPYGDELTVTAATTTDGVVTIDQAAGTLSFDPADDLEGVAVIEYTVCDSASACDNAKIEVDLAESNDAPVAEDDQGFTTDEDTDLTITAAELLGNDIDPDLSEVLTAQIAGAGDLGATVVEDPNTPGTFFYSPAANVNGTETLTYQVCDSSGACDQGDISIEIQPVNDAPVAQDDGPFTVEVDTASAGSALRLLGNDTDVDTGEGDVLSLEPGTFTGSLGGTMSIDADGNGTYTAPAGGSGYDTFSYTVKDTAGATASAIVTFKVVNSVNDVPVAGDDVVALPVEVETPTVLSGAFVLGNDTDADTPFGQSLSVDDVVTVNDPLTSTVTYDPAADEFTYTSLAPHTGTDSFTYRVCDNATTAACATATVSLTVTNTNNPPAANDDGPFTTEVETALSFDAADLVDDDFDPDLAYGDDTFLASLDTTTVEGGTLVRTGTTITYTPPTGFEGSDSFTYIVEDAAGLQSTLPGEVQVNVVNATNDVPVAGDDVVALPVEVETPTVLSGAFVLGNDTDADTPFGQSLSVDDVVTVNDPLTSTVTYDPAADEFTYTSLAPHTGTDSFTYRVCDNATTAACATATVSLTVTNTNNPPAATDDGPLTGEVDQALSVPTIDLLANDTDPDVQFGDTATVVSVSPLSGDGATVVLSETTITYTPRATFSGIDTFTYTIEDAAGAQASATVEVAITNSILNPPVASNDTIARAIEVETATRISGSVLIANDTDADIPYGESLSIDSLVAVNDPLTSTVTYDPVADEFTYTSLAPHTGADSFTYRVCDDAAAPACDTATVSLTVTNTNDTPVANNDGPFATSDNTSLNISQAALVSNDTDADIVYGDTLSIVAMTGPTSQGGTVTVDATGNVLYEPPTDFAGGDSFTYTVEDAAGAGTAASVRVEVSNPNDSPQPGEDFLATSPANGSAVVIPFADLLANDTDPDQPFGQTFTIVGVTENNTNKVVFDAATETITYSSNQSHIGPDTFTYEVCDNDPTNPLCATATVNITVQFANTDPAAGGDAIGTVSVDGSLVIPGATLTTNDVDSDVADFGQQLTITSITTQPSGAGNTVQVVAGDVVITTVETLGADSFTYEVCDDHATPSCSTASVSFEFVNPTNDPPVAVDDLAADIPALRTNENTPLVITQADLLANDTDPDLIFGTDQLTFSILNSGGGFPVPTAMGGELTMASPQDDILYTPTPGFSGQDSFKYEMCDTTPNCATATVYINVLAVDHAPVIAGLDGTPNFDGYEDDVFDVISPGFTDLDISDTHIWSASGLPAGLAIDPATGEISGTPSLGTSTLGPAANGVFEVSVTITDSSAAALSDTKEITITIEQWKASALVGGLVITEVRSHETVNDLEVAVESYVRDGTIANAGTFDEFIEVTNVSPNPIDLVGLRFSDRNVKSTAADAATENYVLDLGTSGTYRITSTFDTPITNAQPVWLAPGDRFVVWMGAPDSTSGKFEGDTSDILFDKNAFLGATSAIEVTLGLSGPVLGDSGDEIFLIDAEGAVIDYVVWGDSTSTVPTESSQPPQGDFPVMAPIDVSTAERGDSLSLAVAFGPTSQTCWEVTATGAATCPGAQLTVDRDNFVDQPGASSVGRRNF